jgi:hypothetical protein
MGQMEWWSWIVERGEALHAPVMSEFRGIPASLVAEEMRVILAQTIAGMRPKIPQESHITIVSCTWGHGVSSEVDILPLHDQFSDTLYCGPNKVSL